MTAKAPGAGEGGERMGVGRVEEGGERMDKLVHGSGV